MARTVCQIVGRGPAIGWCAYVTAVIPKPRSEPTEIRAFTADCGTLTQLNRAQLRRNAVAETGEGAPHLGHDSNTRRLNRL